MAASSGQMYRSCDQIAESGHYRYWPGHHKPTPSVDLAGAHTSSVDHMGPSGYRNVDASMNVHHFHHENCKIPDDSLTLEQRQQRQSKIGRLQVIQQMLAAEQQQVPMSDERMDHMRTATFLQSRVPSAVGWDGVPCGDDMYAGHYNSGSQMMNTNYPSSAMRRQWHAPGWDMMTTAQSRWYHMQRESHVNQMGMPNNVYHCQPTDFHSSNVRYVEPHVSLPNECCQLSMRGRAVPARAVCDCTPVYPLCDPQACMCEGGMSSHMGKHNMLPGGMYGYSDVGMQSNCQQQMNRCSEFVNDKYCMPVDGSRQLAYSMPCKGRADGIQNWNSGESVMKQRLMAGRVPQQFDAQSQQVTLSYQPNNSYCTGTDRSIVAEPVSSVVSAQTPTVAVRQRQPCNSKKRKNNSSFTAASDSKSVKLDCGADEWPPAASATRSGTLMNITSASLAHLAKGVANISAVMQHTIQHGGPFQSVRGQNDHAHGSDENANFIPAGNSLQIHATDALNIVEGKTAVASDCTSVTSPPLSTFQTSDSYSRCSVATISTHSHVHSNPATSGIGVVVMPKAPYTISYRPTGISPEGDSQGNVNVRNESAVAFSHNARMMQQQSNVARHMSGVDAASFSHKYVPISEGFSRLSDEEQYGMTCHKNPADAAKVDQQSSATAGDTCLSMASPVAVIQPQMMSGTQLFIADRCPVSAPVLNNFVLSAGMQSSAFRSSHQSHSMQHGPNYQSFAVQQMPVSRDGSNIPVFYSSPNTVKPNTD